VSESDRYVGRLSNLKPGDLSLLRTHSGQGLDESVPGFDLFTGLWWPLRQRSPRAPRREVAWTVAKLYASCPVGHCPGRTLAEQLSSCAPNDQRGRGRFIRRFDRMLTLPLREIESDLRWAVSLLGSHGLKLDWVQLTDDLSVWQRESVHLRWAKDFLKNWERRG